MTNVAHNMQNFASSPAPAFNPLANVRSLKEGTRVAPSFVSRAAFYCLHRFHLHSRITACQSVLAIAHPREDQSVPVSLDNGARRLAPGGHPPLGMGKCSASLRLPYERASAYIAKLGQRDVVVCSSWQKCGSLEGVLRLSSLRLFAVWRFRPLRLLATKRRA